MNNKGQVLGEVGNLSAGLRYPVVWTNGVAQALPIPSGYSYIANLSTYKINDSGTVIGTVENAGTQRTHIAVWKDGIPTVLPDPPISGCSGNGSSYSYALNNAGSILGTTGYPSSAACLAVWVYNGSSFRFVPTPVLPECTHLPPGYGDGLNYTVAAMNDAGAVVEDVSNIFCTPPYGGSAPFTADGFVIQPSGSYSLLPLGNLFQGTPSYINNLGEALGYYPDPTTLLFWDSNGIHTIGRGGYAYLNNLGQVAYSTGAEGAQGFFIWQNGVSTPMPFPAGLFGPDEDPVTAGFNDAGQVAIQNGNTGYLLTPSGACAQNVTSQVQVTRGGFRLDLTTQHFAQLITITNTGASSIQGPISLALDNLPTSASLFGTSGATLCDAPNGSPYLNAPAASLAPGASTTLTLNFIDAALTGITYTTRVLAGPGGR
jgi:uncharacterized membrane protein